MKIAVLTLGDEGGMWAKRLALGFPSLRELRSRRDGKLQDLFHDGFAAYDGLVCVMATGIAVRMIAPLASSKLTDPAVVVLDDAGRWAISLLSGHEGGANRLAYEVAAITGAEPVITTGSETNRKVTVGIGCRRGISTQAIRETVSAALAEANLNPSDVRCAASIRLKADEQGLIEAMREMDIPLLFIDEERINTYDGPYERGGAAERNLGVRAVAEPCALLSSRHGRLLTRKKAEGGVTVALALEEEWMDL